MLRVSSGATDRSVEASVMEVERCGGIVWEMAWTNLNRGCADGHFKFLHLWPPQNPPLDSIVTA